MAQIIEEVARVEPIPLSSKPILIPGIAVRVLLGGKVMFGGGDQVRLEYQKEPLVVHEKDFLLAKKVAGRIALALPSNKITPATLISAMELAYRFTAEEIFTQGALRILYYPVIQSEASAFYRCVIPSLAINDRGRCVSYVTKERTLRQALDFDVVVFQLDYSGGVLKFSKELQKMGKKTVFEIDDAFDALEEWHPSYQHFVKAGVQDQIRAVMGSVDLVTVTTPYLAERYGKYAKAIEVIPNCVTIHDLPKAEPHGTGKFRVLWAGSPSHFGDLAQVADALREFALAHDDVRLVFFGRKPVGLDDIADKVEFHPWVNFGDFPQKLADLSADVAIAPLADVPFNYAKSNLRIIQYGAAGYPIIGSPVGEYKRTGLGRVSLASSKEEWVEALELHRSDADFRKLMKVKAEDLAADFDIAKHAPEIERIYLQLAGRES